MGQQWPASGLRDTACLRACIGPFKGGHHYVHYLHYSSGQITGRKHISALQQKNWIKDLMSMAQPIRTRPSFPVNLSHHRGLECKTRKSRNTWSNRQIWPRSTKQSRSKANKVLKRELTGHRKHPLLKLQGKTPHVDITRWLIPKSD